MQLCYDVRYVNGLLAQQLCAVLCQSTFWAFADKALLIGGCLPDSLPYSPPPSHSNVPGLFCRLLGCTELPLAFSFECLQQVRLQCFSACTAPAVNAGHKVTDIL